MNHVFSQIPKVKVPRSMFRRNHNLKTTIGADYLYPIYCDEALPGDTFKMSAHLFGRLSTPIVPIMDNLYLDTFFFAVPIRLIDKNWKNIMGESSLTYPTADTFEQTNVPMLRAPTGGFATGSLHDYIGLPTRVGGFDFCPYWHRAYNLIFNEWFRDENLEAFIPVGGRLPDGTERAESVNDYTLRRRCKAHDYFTSALPWPQKGQPATFSFGGDMPVSSNGNPFALNWIAGDMTEERLVGMAVREADPVGSGGGAIQVMVPTTTPTSNTIFATGAGGKLYWPDSADSTSALGLTAHLSSVTAVTINQLREAVAVQRFMETDARSGTRYIEIIRGHFGVVSPDARMQRPEYLGGFSQRLNVTSVAQTSASSDVSPQGNLAAFVTGTNSSSWVKSFTEHCVILGLANIRGEQSYQYGLPRMFSRKTKYDFYWPEFANLGEQEIKNKEIYCQGTSADDGTFGYQERWAEYRYHPNMITGYFRSNATDSNGLGASLDYWHLAQRFGQLPTLSAAFVLSSVPVDRVLAVSEFHGTQFILDGWFDLQCARPMPLYSVPGLGSRL